MLVFIDESGHPRPSDSTTRPVLSAVCIHETDTGRLIRSMFGLRRNLLGGLKLTKAEQEGKANSLLNRYSLTKSTAKREFVDSLFEFLREFPITAFAIVMERPQQVPYQGRDFLQTHYRRLLQRIDLHMEQSHPSSMAIPIFDGQDPISNRIFADCFTGYMVKSAGGRGLTHVVPTPLFVDSSLTPGIQIADWFAYVIRVAYEQNLFQTYPISDPYLSAIKRYANIVRSKSVDFKRDPDFTWFGIATMDADKFVYEQPEIEIEEEEEDLPIATFDPGETSDENRPPAG